MTGNALRALRERLHLNQPEFALWLNERLGRRYDKQKISKWEVGREKLPRDVAGALALATLELDRDGRRGPGTVVAVALQKGGTGKTATSVNLAYTLARAGNRVLLVDADSQGNATIHAGLPPEQLVELTRQGKTHYHALTGKTPLSGVVITSAAAGFDLVPASIALAAAEADLYHEPTGIGAMAEMLSAVRGQYDHIIIDCSPSLGMVTSAALTAADYLLIPCQTEAHAILGLEHLTETVAKIRRRANPNLRILGIVPTMYSARQSQDRASLDELHSLWSGQAEIFEPIPRSTLYSQAAAANVITMAGDPGVPGAETFIAIARRLMQAAGQIPVTAPPQDAIHAA